MQTIKPEVDIILGCMWSGKTTELMRRIDRYQAVNIRTLIIKQFRYRIEKC